ncbi:MAG: glycosyltransferase family 87 protein [Candidatus Acidiferrales bacterium]
MRLENSTVDAGNDLIQIRFDHRVLFGFLILTSVMNAVILFIPWKEIMAGKNDFPVFYSSAQMVHEGQASHLYDFDAENRFVHRVSDVTRAPNNHLPYELLIFVPLTFLRFGAAHIAWTLLSMAMLVGVALMTRNIGPGALSFATTLLTILAFFPVWYCLLQGQDSILLLFLFTFSFWLWKRGQDDLAGFVLAMGLFRPQLVLPFAFVVFLAGKWKFIRGFIPGAILALLASTWVVGLHGMAEYGKVLISQGTESSASALAKQWQVRPGLMATWRGFLWVCLPTWVPGGVRNGLLLSGTFAGLFWAGKKLRAAKDRLSLELAFAFAVAAVALVSFHSFLNDFSLLVLPLLIFGACLAAPYYVQRKTAHLVVTLAFSFFLTPLYLLLLAADRVGLFLTIELAALWLVSRTVGNLSAGKLEPESAAAISAAVA